MPRNDPKASKTAPRMPRPMSKATSGTASPPTTEIDVLPLTPERFADLAALFEEGGDPKWCWYQSQVGTPVDDGPA